MVYQVNRLAVSKQASARKHNPSVTLFNSMDFQYSTSHTNQIKKPRYKTTTLQTIQGSISNNYTI